MICDAHIHVGYYQRKGCGKPFYYSPRRICTILKKCGVDEFIYSSTSMQTHWIDYCGVNAEMKEVRRLFGKGAHPFLWVTRRYLDSLPRVVDLGGGFYEGIKLHGMDGSHWVTKEQGSLEQILMDAERSGMPVMIHTGMGDDARPANYIPFILRHPRIRFNLAHGRPLCEAEQCMDAAANVFVDVSCMRMADVCALIDDGRSNRLLWGTDFPSLMALRGDSLTCAMRKAIVFYDQLSKEGINFADNFRRYLNGTEEPI